MQPTTSKSAARLAALASGALAIGWIATACSAAESDEPVERREAPIAALEGMGGAATGSTSEPPAESPCACPVGPGETIFVANDDDEPADPCKKNETHAACLSGSCVVQTVGDEGPGLLQIRSCGGWPPAPPQAQYGCRCPVDESKGEILPQDAENGCADRSQNTCSWGLCKVIVGTSFHYTEWRTCEYVPEPPPCACPAFADEYVDPDFDGCASPKDKLACRQAYCLVDGWDVRACAWVAPPPSPLPDTPCACQAGEGEYVPVGEDGAVNDCLPQAEEAACTAKTCTVAIGDPDDATADEWVTRPCGWTPPCACPIGPDEELREVEDVSNMCPDRHTANACTQGLCAVGTIGEAGYEIRNCAWNPDAPEPGG